MAVVVVVVLLPGSYLDIAGALRHADKGGPRSGHDIRGLAQPNLWVR